MNSIAESIAHIMPPSRKLKLKELRVVSDVAKGLVKLTGQSSSRLDTERHCMMLPGLGGHSTMMYALSRTARRHGFTVHDWGLGWNDGDVEALLPKVRQQIERLSYRQQTNITLIGWSLGGYLAREAARDLPDQVNHIITMGTPVVGGPRFTSAAKLYERKGWSLDDIQRETIDRFSVPLTTPVTALYSKNDGIVSWEACIDHWSPNVSHVELECSHLGMPIAPDAIEAVERALGSPALARH